ncbi:MAG: hypothetical protein ACKO7O_07320 [Bacteroidota bacterium]
MFAGIIKPYFNRSTPSSEEISIYLKKSSFFIYADIVFRTIVGLVGIVIAKEKGYTVGLGMAFYALHFVLLFITVYYAKRRVNAANVYLKNRIMAYEGYAVAGFTKEPERQRLFIYSETSNISVKALVYGLVFCLVSSSIFWLSSSFAWYHVFFLLVSFLTGFTYAKIYSCIFLQRDIEKVYFSGKLLSEADLLQLKLYLNEERFIQNYDLDFWNDKYIAELDKDFNIYKEKLETFLIESVFLGALTFSSVIQIMGLDGNEKEEYIQFVNDFLANPSINGTLVDHLSLKFGFGFLLVGSVISSLMYMVVLFKRFPIIKNIETVRGLLNIAKFYNDKEEEMKEKWKKDHYTKQIQVQIANCQEQKLLLESNLKIISMFRFAGLFCFLIVLIIASWMISFALLLAAVFVMLYLFIASRVIEDNTVLKKYVFETSNIDKKKKSK